MFEKSFASKIMYLLAMIIGFPSGFVVVFLNQLKSEITGSYLVLGLGEALFTIALATMGTIWGVALDFVERKELVVVAALEISAFFIYLLTIASSPILYILARFMTGFFMSVVYAYVVIILSVYLRPGERISTYTNFTFLNAAFTGIGAGFSYVVQYFVYWRSVIAIYASIMGLLSLLILGFRVRVSNQVKSGIIKFFFGEFRSFFSRKTNILLGLQGFFGSLPWGAISLFLIYSLIEHFGSDFAVSGLLVAFGFFGYIFSLPLMRYFDKLRKRGSKMKLVGTYPTIPITAQAILFFAIFSLPKPGTNLSFSLTSLSLPYLIGFLSRFISQQVYLETALLFVIINFFAVQPGPITRNILVDVNPKEYVGSASMILRFFEVSGTGFGIFLGGLLVDLTGSFQTAILSLACSWFISAPIWILIGGYYAREGNLI